MKKKTEFDEFDIPTEFEWDQMKSGIFEKMNAHEAKRRRSPGVFHFDKRLVLVLLAIFSSLVGALFLMPNSILPFQKHYNQQRNQEGPSTMQLQVDSIVQNAFLAVSPVLETVDSPTHIQNIEFVFKGEMTGNSLFNVQISEEGLKQGLMNEESEKIDQKRWPYAQLFTEKNAPADQSDSMDLLRTGICLEKEVHQQWSIDSPSLLLAGPLDSASVAGLVRVRPNWIQVKAGAMFWNDFSNVPDRDQTESAQLSLLMNLNYYKALGKNSYGVAGVSYSQFESKCEFERLIQGYVITRPNQIIRVEHNSLTGELTSIVGSVSDTVEAVHFFRNYNSTKVLALSMGFGHGWEWGSHRMTILGGTSYGIWSSNRGKVLFNGDVVELKELENSSLSNRHTADGFLDVQYWKPLNESLELTSGLNIQKSLSNWSSISGTHYSPGSISMQIGLVYKLSNQ